MTITKRKIGVGGEYTSTPSLPMRETTGCGTYTGAAIQYPLIGGIPTMLKLVIGGLCLLIPVIGTWILTGYGLRATRRVIQGNYRLPDFDDFAGDFVSGLIVTLGLIVFGVLLSISTILVVTVPIVIVFGIPMFGFVLARYASTDDFASFFDIIGAYRAVFYRFGDALMMSIGSFITVVAFSVLVGIGTICLLIPGMMAAAALVLAIAFNVGVFGRVALDI
mgnify:CR=1 FL=1